MSLFAAVVFTFIAVWTIRWYGRNISDWFAGIKNNSLPGWQRQVEDQVRQRLPTLIRAVLLLVGLTLVFFALSLGLILEGVEIEETRRAGAVFSLGMMNGLPVWPWRIGLGLLIAWSVWTLVAAVFQRSIWKVLAVIGVIFLVWFECMACASLREYAQLENTYLMASLLVAAGGLIFGPWIHLLIKIVYLVMAVVTLVVGVVTGTVMAALEAAQRYLSAFGIAKPPSGGGAGLDWHNRFQSAVWPILIYWAMPVTVLLVFPYRTTLLVIVPFALILWGLYMAMVRLGYRERITLIYFWGTSTAVVVFFLARVFTPSVANYLPIYVEKVEMAARCEQQPTLPKCKERALADSDTAEVLENLAKALGEPGAGSVAGAGATNTDSTANTSGGASTPSADPSPQ